MTAALRGSREIGFTIISMTVSLAAVFIPVLFMGGIVGRLLHEFAVTMGVAILISGFVSLSLTPMLSARFLRSPPGAEARARCTWRSSVCSTRRATDTRWLLHKAMVHHGMTMAASALLLVATVYCFRIIPMGFIPSQDIGQINGQTEMAQGLGFPAMVDHQIAVMKRRPGRSEREVGDGIDRRRRRRSGRQWRTDSDRAETAGGALDVGR